MRIIALFISGLPVRECRAPAEIDRLAARGFERKASDIERCSCLPITKVGHDGCEIGARDDVEQFLLVGRKPRPHLTQIIDRVDVGNDGVMARAF